jgi:hypothetical protein
MRYKWGSPAAKELFLIIMTAYMLEDRSSRVRFPEEAGNFSLLHIVQTVAGAHPASCKMGNGGSFPEGEADHSFPSSAEVKECVALYLHPNTSSWRGA